MGSSILQAILGGVAGGAQGIAQTREQRRAEEEQRRTEARQQMLDRIGLAERGWVTPAQQTDAMRRATPGVQSVMESASSMLSGGAPKALNMESLQQGAGKFGAPAGRITMGGDEFVLPETGVARQERQLEMERGEKRYASEQERRAAEARAQQIDAALSAVGVGAEQRALVRSGAMKPNDVMPRETQLPWQKEGFKSMQEYLDFKSKESAVTRAPRVGREALSDREQKIRDINEEMVRFARTPIKTVTGERLPKEQEIYQHRDKLIGLLGLSPTSSMQAPRTESQAPAASAAAQGASLEQEFPNAVSRIREARLDGYSDEEIRAYLSRGR